MSHKGILQDPPKEADDCLVHSRDVGSEVARRHPVYAHNYIMLRMLV